ncbi:acyl-CoA thioesterase II [Gammaproteobacteria bacterium 45_16_T64]|nr:acyl-CoA thioesterase II [Gammaproteobacteria bacterium 45_16_T64]
MNNLVDDFLQIMDLETLEQNLFRGKNREMDGRSVFGGQVVAQALMAAHRTLREHRQAHSLHGYFLRPGDVSAPIVYEVDRIRDGGSFTTRRVIAIQHGEVIFNLSASFQEDEDGFEHQANPLPDVPPPEDVEHELELRKRVAHNIPEKFREAFLQPRLIEIRPIDPVDYFQPEAKQPYKKSWFRVPGTLNGELGVHQAALAYASDFGLLGTGMLPHKLSFMSPNVQAASLDHAIWFHHAFRADEWLLYDMESPSSSGARSFNRGQIYNQAGILVASIAQEGLMRVRKK